MKKILITLLVLAFFVSCKQDKKETETTTENTKTEPLKAFMFDGGTVQVNTLEIFSQGDLYKGESKTFANMFFVPNAATPKLFDRLWKKCRFLV